MTLSAPSALALRSVAGAGVSLWRFRKPRSRAGLALGRWYRRRALELGGPAFFPEIGRVAVPPESPAVDEAGWMLARQAWLAGRPRSTVLPERVIQLVRIGHSVVPNFASTVPGRTERLRRVVLAARATRAAAGAEELLAGLGAQLQRVVIVSLRASRATTRLEAGRERRLGWLVLADVTLQLVTLSNVGFGPAVETLLATVPLIARALVAPR